MEQLVLKGLLTPQEEEECRGEGKREETQPWRRERRRDVSWLGWGRGQALPSKDSSELSWQDGLG